MDIAPALLYAVYQSSKASLTLQSESWATHIDVGHLVFALVFGGIV